jgi:hypothetical protein
MTTAFVYTTFTWTGPLPTEVDTTCRFVQDTSGVPNKDAYVGEDSLRKVPVPRLTETMFSSWSCP